MSYEHLSMDERNVIYRMRFQGYPDAEIARCLGCHRSTIGRECKRNAGPDGRYYAESAQTWANVRRRAHLRRPKTGDPHLMAYVDDRLRQRWSPEQIAGRLVAHPPAPQAPRLPNGLRGLPCSAAGIVLVPDSRRGYTPSVAAEDRALRGSNPSAAAAQGQGRRCAYTTWPCPLYSLSLAQSAESQGFGDSEVVKEFEV